MLIKSSSRGQAQMVTTNSALTPPTQQSGQGLPPALSQQQQEQRQESPTSEQQQQQQQQRIQQQLQPQQNPALELTQQRAVSAASVDSGQKDQSAPLDQQEIIWNKLQDLKDKYLLDMYDFRAVLVNHINDNQQSMPPDQLQMLNHYKDVLSRMISYLTASRTKLPKEFGLDKMESFEKQVVSIVETFRKRTPQQHQRQQQPEAVDSGQTAQSATLDQQEMVWNKLQNLKEQYLSDMNDLRNMLVARRQQSMTPDQLQKLNHYTDVLNRMIPYLSVSRTNLPKEFRLDKLEVFEKQIGSIMEIFKKRKQQQQEQGMPISSVQHPPVAPVALPETNPSSSSNFCSSNR